MNHPHKLSHLFLPLQLLLIGGAIFLSVGCQPITPPAPATGTQPPAQAESGSPAQLASADLAEHLAVAVETIEVVEVKDVSWPDTSLGCPAPETMYAQVVTPGTRILLTVDGQKYTYHAEANQPPCLCENPTEDGTVGS